MSLILTLSMRAWRGRDQRGISLKVRRNPSRSALSIPLNRADSMSLTELPNFISCAHRRLAGWVSVLVHAWAVAAPLAHAGLASLWIMRGGNWLADEVATTFGQC